MANLFVKEKLVDPYIIAIDSTLLRAKGHLWHKSSMIKVRWRIRVIVIRRIIKARLSVLYFSNTLIM
jgi:hypothetical protein